MNNDEIQLIAEQITATPSQWVLVVGDDVSYTKSSDPHNAILNLVYQYKAKLSEKPGFYQYIFEENSMKLSELLFGDVWNGVSFLNKDSKIQMNLRVEYANSFSKKEEINLHYINDLLRNALPLFQGAILTFCRDETIEALLEYEKSLFVNEIVWTPYDMLTSPRWKKWEESFEIANDSNKVFEPIFTDMHMLLKLNGSCRTPHQMPLSRNDYELYYPTAKNENPCTKNFLKQLLEQKNLLFLGFDSDVTEITSSDAKYPKPFAPGISCLLTETKGKGFRYFVSESGDTENYFLVKYGMTLIEKHDFEKIIHIAKKRQCNYQPCDKNNSQQDSAKNQPSLTPDQAENLFWHYYVRRQKNLISENEKYILKQILSNNLTAENTSNPVWDKSGISLLSMIANKQADFYNLKKMTEDSRNELTSEDRSNPIFRQKNMLWHLLFEKLSDRSKELLLILKHYNSGFPVGFLQLLSKNEKELESWKKAGFQLANSGIYIRRHYRKNLYKRMEYADSLLLTAGKDIAQKQIPMSCVINEVEHQLDDSYFYPSDDRVITDDLLTNFSNFDINQKYNELLKHLQIVLEEKSEGYHHIRSLLETEFHAIICIIQEFYKTDQDYITKLLYHLLLESHGIPKNIEILESILTKENQKYSSNNSSTTAEDNEISVCHKSKLLCVQAMIKSYSSDLSQSNEAITLCMSAENLFKDLGIDYQREKMLISKKTFEERLQILFLKSRIYERIHIHEVLNGKTNNNKNLSNMHKTLETIDVLLAERTKLTHNKYEELEAHLFHRLGKYFYHMNQFYKSSDETNQKCKKSYKTSAKYLEEALKYYQKYPHRYLIQRADVMRDMADLYIHGSERQHMENGHEDGYALLAKAYKIYRKNADLHGIANVLLSIGKAEDHSEIQEPSLNRRSLFCFYKTAKDIYHHLGDYWKEFVVSNYEMRDFHV